MTTPPIGRHFGKYTRALFRLQANQISFSHQMFGIDCLLCSLELIRLKLCVQTTATHRMVCSSEDTGLRGRVAAVTQERASPLCHVESDTNQTQVHGIWTEIRSRNHISNFSSAKFAFHVVFCNQERSGYAKKNKSIWASSTTSVSTLWRCSQPIIFA